MLFLGGAAMSIQCTFSHEEWSLLLELLEHERSELPAEIRHTRLQSVRDQLRQRLRLVDQMLERLRPVVETWG